MSETISFVAESEVGVLDQTIESYGPSVEAIDKQWDRDDLTPLVRANANAPVLWQGSEMTLSEAIENYLAQNPVTEESQDIAIAVVLELLANPVIKTEEPAEEDMTEEEPAKIEAADKKSNTKTEAQKPPENPKTVEPQKQPKQEVSEAKRLEPSTSNAEKISESQDSSSIKPEPEVLANHRLESERSNQNVAKVEATANAIASEALALTSNTSGSSPQESVINQTTRGLAPLALSLEAKPAFDGRKLVANQETEKHTLPIAIETTAEPEAVELSGLDFERAIISDDPTELGDEKNGVTEDKSELVVIDHPMVVDGLTNFTEEEVPLDHIEETGLEPNELYEFYNIPSLEVARDSQEAGEEALISRLGYESNLSGQMEIGGPEQLVRVSLTIEGIEDCLIQLSERIKASEPETTEQVNEILDKIIEVPAKLEARSGENIFIEVEAQEELEELFTKLLDKMGIDYTPELIEALARLTLKWHLADEIEQLKNEEETDKAPQGIGTHEIIKKLLAGLRIIKKAMTHACAIGKSALQLYIVNFAT